MEGDGRIVVTNIVLKFCLPFDIDLHKLKDHFENTDYRPKRFNGAIVKTKNNCMLVFRNGKVNVVGSKTEESAHAVIDQLCGKLGHSNINCKGQVVNIVAKSTLGRAINLQNLGSDGEFEYNPELYPAAYYKFGKAKVSVFHTGKLIFTGFTIRNDLFDAHDEVNLAIKLRLL